MKFYFEPSNDLLVHSVLTGPVPLTNIKEEDAILIGQKFVQNSFVDKALNKKVEIRPETRESTNSKISQKKGIFSFLFKKSKSMPDLKVNGNQIENGK